ncbi:unnamed protein product [Ectocarpus sp. 6 AP-2014]
MYMATLFANDKEKTGLTKEVCERFRGLDDFDRHVMTKIFTFSICNDRVCALLDRAMTLKTKDIPVIEHHLDEEFVYLFFNILESLVGRGHTLTDLGYAASVTSSDMEGARQIINQHVDDIATKCSPCFKPNVLKTPRGQNNLFPAGGALPHVSIGCTPVNYDETTIDTLKESLLEKEEKGEFLEMMFAAISHASNEPVVTYRGLKLESVKTFFLEKILDKAQADETLQLMCASDEARELCKEVVTLSEELSSVKEELSSVKEELSTLEQQRSSTEEKYRSLAKENPVLKRKNEELEHELPRVKQALEHSEKFADDLNKYYQRNFVKKKSRISAKEKNDKIWRLSSGEHSEEEEKETMWSGDEEE